MELFLQVNATFALLRLTVAEALRLLGALGKVCGP